MPRAHEPGEAENELLAQAEARLRRLARGQLAKALAVDSVRKNVQSFARLPCRRDDVHQRVTDRKDGIGGAPGVVLRPAGDALQDEAAVPPALLAQRRIDFEQKGDSGAPAQPGPG